MNGKRNGNGSHIHINILQCISRYSVSCGRMLDNVMEMSAATTSTVLRDYVLPLQRPFRVFPGDRWGNAHFHFNRIKFLHKLHAIQKRTRKVQTAASHTHRYMRWRILEHQHCCESIIVVLIKLNFFLSTTDPTYLNHTDKASWEKVNYLLLFSRFYEQYGTFNVQPNYSNTCTQQPVNSLLTQRSITALIQSYCTLCRWKPSMSSQLVCTHIFRCRLHLTLQKNKRWSEAWMLHWFDFICVTVLHTSVTYKSTLFVP